MMIEPPEIRTTPVRCQGLVSADQLDRIGGGDGAPPPAAAERVLDDGVRGNGDVVDLAVCAAERSGIEIDRGRRGPSGYVQRVVRTSGPKGNDRMRVPREIEEQPERAGEVAVEAEHHAAAGERTRRRRAVEPLRRQYVHDHRRRGS